MSVHKFPGVYRLTVRATTQHLGGNGGGGNMGARLAKLEANMEHVQTDCVDIKADLRSVRDKITDIKDSIAAAKVWALLLYVGLAAGLLYAMARGFKWL